MKLGKGDSRPNQLLTGTHKGGGYPCRPSPHADCGGQIQKMVEAVRALRLVQATPSWVELEWELQTEEENIVPVAEIKRIWQNEQGETCSVRRCVKLAAAALRGKIFNLQAGSEYQLRVGSSGTNKEVIPTPTIAFSTPGKWAIEYVIVLNPYWRQRHKSHYHRMKLNVLLQSTKSK